LIERLVCVDTQTGRVRLYKVSPFGNTARCIEEEYIVQPQRDELAAHLEYWRRGLLE
jgi:hypothetical protein